MLETRPGRGYIRRRHACTNAVCAGIANVDDLGRVRSRGVRWNTYELFSERRGTITVPRDTRAIRSV